ncbi:MAG: 50S ribosomal protein L4 [Chloroflexi bacterium]|nr:50S ribosomal protein L4 [Chloroflexota bacterium]
MEVQVRNLQGEKIKTVELPPEIFEAEINESLMHQALMRQLANARLGTHKTKSRGEVSGGGKKPYKQKGTGHARQGSRRAPQFKGGGKVHTPQPRDYTLKMPRQMRRAALRSALSVKAAGAQIVVVDQLELDAPKTSVMIEALGKLGVEGSALVLLDAKNENVEKSVRNIAGAKILRANYLNVRDLLGCDIVVMPLGALDVIKSFLGGVLV